MFECQCPTLKEGINCPKKCLPVSPARWWELCSQNCPPEQPCNEEDSIAVRRHCGGYYPEPPKPPSLLQMVKEFAYANLAELAHRTSGKPGPTWKEKEDRRKICDSCDQRDKETDSCTICGCSLEAKLLPPILLGKLDMATQVCPKNLWGSVGGAEPQNCGGCGKT